MFQKFSNLNEILALLEHDFGYKFHSVGKRTFRSIFEEKNFFKNPTESQQGSAMNIKKHFALYYCENPDSQNIPVDALLAGDKILRKKFSRILLEHGEKWIFCFGPNYCQLRMLRKCSKRCTYLNEI